MDLGDGLRLEPNLTARAGDVQAVMDVAIGLLLVEIGERAADRHALVELRHLRRANLVEQLRLSDENDLNELFLIGLEVREHANLLEELRREVLRLVEDRDAALSERELREQELIEAVEQLLA